MNKSLFASDIDVPPLLMLSLATVSLVFNLCFPQYTAYANTRKQKFIAENGLKESKIALNSIKTEAQNVKKDTKSEIQTVTQNQTFSELKVEKAKKPTVKGVSVKKAIQTQTMQTGSSTAGKSHWVTVTAYSSTVDQCDSNPFVTASGSRVRDGIIATNLLAFGTKVKFPSLYGDKIFVVEDRMSKRFSNRADIWFETREQAKQFGVKKTEMVVVS